MRVHITMQNYCRTQHSTEQFPSSRQASLLRSCLSEGEGEKKKEMEYVSLVIRNHTLRCLDIWNIK